MLAHSMAHSTLRHSTRSATRGQIANYGSIPLIFLGSWTGSDELAIPMGFLQSQRAFELEADGAAVRAMAAAGYDPHALPAYIARVQAPNRRSQIYACLPSSSQRIGGMEQTIRELAERTYSPGGNLVPVQEEIRNWTAVHRPDLVRRPPSLLR